jgi:hypothetical protein
MSKKTITSYFTSSVTARRSKHSPETKAPLTELVNEPPPNSNRSGESLRDEVRKKSQEEEKLFRRRVVDLCDESSDTTAPAAGFFRKYSSASSKKEDSLVTVATQDASTPQVMLSCRC